MDDDTPRIPAHTEMTVLGPDDPKARTVGFTVWEEKGPPVYKIPPDWTPPEGVEDLPRSYWQDYEVRDRDGLKVGDMVLVPVLLGYVKAFVQAEKDKDQLVAKSENLLCLLEYVSRRGGEYYCWCSTAAINARALKRLEIEREDS